MEEEKEEENVLPAAHDEQTPEQDESPALDPNVP